jgi:hypothetical protein
MEIYQPLAISARLMNHIKCDCQVPSTWAIQKLGLTGAGVTCHPFGVNVIDNTLTKLTYCGSSDSRVDNSGLDLDLEIL